MAEGESTITTRAKSVGESLIHGRASEKIDAKRPGLSPTSLSGAGSACWAGYFQTPQAGDGAMAQATSR